LSAAPMSAFADRFEGTSKNHSERPVRLASDHPRDVFQQPARRPEAVPFGEQHATHSQAASGIVRDSSNRLLKKDCGGPSVVLRGVGSGRFTSHRLRGCEPSPNEVSAQAKTSFVVCAPSPIDLICSSGIT